MLSGGVRFSRLADPTMAAEDFSYFGQTVPSVFSFLGIADKDLGTDASLHNPLFRYVFPVIDAMHA